MAKKDDKKIEKVIKKVATAPNSKFSRRGDRLWYRMDSAGLIFIPASNGGWACAFRTACVLKSKVDPVVLQQALNDIKPRFPSIMVHLKVGLFWHYLENSKEPLMVKKETLYPLRKFSLQSRRYVVRILYQNNRIAFECFHAISDANGAFIFLNSLVRQYLILKGVKIESFDGCKNPLDKPMPEETENAFMRYADPTKRNKYQDKKALRFKYEKEEYGVFNLLHINLDTKQLKTIAKSKGATIGEFLTTALAYSLYKEVNAVRIEKKGKNPIKISVPIDLRRKFPSSTLRNFSLYMNMAVDHNEEHTFETTLEVIKKCYSSITEEYLVSSITNNVKLANAPYVKFMPLPIKNIALKLGYNILGENLTTMSFSNMGVQKAPSEFAKHIERYEFALGPLKLTPVNVACVSYNDSTVLTVSSRAKNTNLERTLIKLLEEQGLTLLLDGNRQELN